MTKPSQTTVRPLPIVVEMHGGGFVLGSAASNDDTNQRMASEVPCIAVAVDYRLSPEFPYPAAVVDCVAAVLWAAGSAESWGGDPGRIGVLGTSAGACLAACTALHVRDEGGPRLAMQALIEPALDDRDDTPSMVDGSGAVFWNSRNALLSWQHYLAGRVPDEYTTPSRRRDLSGLPPTYLTVNELDPLRDQGIDYARRVFPGKSACCAFRCCLEVHGEWGIPAVAEALMRATGQQRSGPHGRQAALKHRKVADRRTYASGSTNAPGTAVACGRSG